MMKWTTLIAMTLLVPVVPSAEAQMHDGGTDVSLRRQGNRLVVPVRAADGSEYEFYLSTGNGVTVLSESAAARIESEAAQTRSRSDSKISRSSRAAFSFAPITRDSTSRNASVVKRSTLASVCFRS